MKGNRESCMGDTEVLFGKLDLFFRWSHLHGFTWVLGISIIMLALEMFLANVYWKRTRAISGVTGNDIVMETACRLWSYMTGIKTCRRASHIHSLCALFNFIFLCCRYKCFITLFSVRNDFSVGFIKYFYVLKCFSFKVFCMASHFCEWQLFWCQLYVKWGLYWSDMNQN